MFAAALLIAACSSGQNARQGVTTPAPSLRNPLDFALYPGASIVSVNAFTQKISVSNAGGSGSVFDAGNGTYTGHEVMAASAASFQDLSGWVSRLSASPPSGYTALETGGNPQAAEQAQRYGIDYASFARQQQGHRRGVLVIVMDPQRVNERFGRILGMVAKYRMLPQAMRGPIDNEARARFGMTISDAIRPESPIGAALASLDQFGRRDARGIVVIDAVKQ